MKAGCRKPVLGVWSTPCVCWSTPCVYMLVYTLCVHVGLHPVCVLVYTLCVHVGLHPVCVGLHPVCTCWSTPCVCVGLHPVFALVYTLCLCWSTPRVYMLFYTPCVHVGLHPVCVLVCTLCVSVRLQATATHRPPIRRPAASASRERRLGLALQDPPASTPLPSSPRTRTGERRRCPSSHPILEQVSGDGVHPLTPYQNR